MKVKYLGYHCVAGWSWNVELDNCSICRMPYNSCCSDCRFPGEECPIVKGECSHVFHLHCVRKWTEQQESCPMCRQTWTPLKYFNVS
ncbi:hypothetical protein GJ496_007231 [Pomphorhynchus laevis]|nr:hypothetical protein GJ496_007231 [Pomphorhynchus laevis]